MRPAQIVVLAIALGAAGLAVLLVGRSEAPPPVVESKPVPTANVLVAKTDIPFGQTLSAEHVEWQAWPLESAKGDLIRQSERANAPADFTGSLVRSSFVAGEPIREAKLIKSNGSGFLAAILPAGMRAAAIEISPESGAGGFILPNDRVDVILTRRDANADRRGSGSSSNSERRGGPRPSETILTNIRVLAIDQAIQEKNGERVVIGKTATLELAPGQAERLALSRQQGTLSLTLRSMADINAPPPAATKGTPADVNLVRFGVSTSAATTTAPE